MSIPIPIPVSTAHTATAHGAVWKFVTCGHCRGPFAYRMRLAASGECVTLPLLDSEEAARAARAKAEENLAKQAGNKVLPIPCPHCGMYQADMIEVVREDQPVDRLGVSGVLLTLLAFIPLLLPVPGNWVATAVVAPVGVALIVYGFVRESRFDPNAGDPEQRKRLGRRLAVWGKAYDGLAGAAAAPGPGAAPARTAGEVVDDLGRAFFNPDGTPKTGPGA